MTMKMHPITSSAIRAHGHDPATGKMRVELHNGKTYDYSDVSLEKYAAFTGAASPGAFWNKRIKGGHMAHEIKQKSEE